MEFINLNNKCSKESTYPIMTIINWIIRTFNYISNISDSYKLGQFPVGQWKNFALRHQWSALNHSIIVRLIKSYIRFEYANHNPVVSERHNRCYTLVLNSVVVTCQPKRHLRLLCFWYWWNQHPHGFHSAPNNFHVICSDKKIKKLGYLSILH